MDRKDKAAGRNTAGGKDAMPAETAPEAPARAPRVTPAAVRSAIAGERASLPPQARRTIEGHRVANSLHALNARVYQEVASFKPVTLVFANLRANSNALLTLRPDQEAIWSDGAGRQQVGLSLSSTSDPVMYLNQFLINAREIMLQASQDVREIRASLYLRTDQSGVLGRVMLPPGASVTLQSRNDRSTVIGVSSFALALD
ncbi:hypothetical protein F3J18_23805 [Burkholderia sp. Ax-1720]|nr:hypothetical protein [Burkholderia sp. Ax-1720]